MDECHFQQHGSRLAAWFPKDEKDPIVRHAPTRKKVGIIGAVKADNGTLVACEEDKFNAQTIEAFFSELVKHREFGKTMVVVLAPGFIMLKLFPVGLRNIQRILAWASCLHIARN
jgi:hypothetical protein